MAEIAPFRGVLYDTDRVDASAPVLRAMLPKDDSVSRTKLYEFLSGWMGGPNLYIEKRGHPRLRMRHFPFAIGRDEVLVGRIRKDLVSDALWLWQVSDNLRKGAATNAVQIAEALVERGLV